MVGQRGVLFVLHRAVQAFVLCGYDVRRVELHPVSNGERSAGGSLDWHPLSNRGVLLHDRPQPRKTILRQCTVAFYGSEIIHLASCPLDAARCCCIQFKYIENSGLSTDTQEASGK